MRYQVVDGSGELLCESRDLRGAELAAEFFRDRWVTCEVIDTAATAKELGVRDIDLRRQYV